MEEDLIEVKMKGDVGLVRDAIDLLLEYFEIEEISSSSSGKEGEAHFRLKPGGLDD